jgi:hypothetical protein
VKVFPADYKRVLAELDEQEQEQDRHARTHDAADFEDAAVDVVGAPHTRLDEGE